MQAQTIGKIIGAAMNLNPAQGSGAESVLISTFDVLELGYDTALPEPKKCKFCGEVLERKGIKKGDTIEWFQWLENCKCIESKAAREKFLEDRRQEKIQQILSEYESSSGERIERVIKKSGIKKRFMTRTFENFKRNAENSRAYDIAKKYADNFKYHADRGEGLHFEGTFGTGKTHLATAIALQLLNQGTRVIFRTFIDMLADIKKTFGADAGLHESQVLDTYKKVNLLIIDDLGKEMSTTWTVPVLYSIINDRYEELKPTIITTNYNERMLIEKLTPKGSDDSAVRAVISRLHECNKLVSMDWEDYR